MFHSYLVLHCLILSFNCPCSNLTQKIHTIDLGNDKKVDFHIVSSECGGVCLCVCSCLCVGSCLCVYSCLCYVRVCVYVCLFYWVCQCVCVCVCEGWYTSVCVQMHKYDLSLHLLHPPPPPPPVGYCRSGKVQYTHSWVLSRCQWQYCRL